MKKHIDKLCLQGNNIITLIKQFIKHKIKQHKKGGNNYVCLLYTSPSPRDRG